MSRPWRSRIWFYKPELYWHGWKTLRPFMSGGDEFNWHTLAIGWNLLGQVVIATRPCDGSGKCATDLADPDIPDHFILASEWPVDLYGHNHIACSSPDCYCREDAS